MFVISNFLVALAKLLGFVLNTYIYIVIARAVISWIRVDAYHPAVRILYQLTEPVLSRIRNILPPFSGLDLSPMVLIFALVFLESFLVQTLYGFAKALQ